MSRSQVTWGLVLARAGSKGIAHKNLVSLGGMPLVLHAVHQALRVESIDRVVVSTNDAEVAAIVKQLDVLIVERPGVYATDTARSATAAIHALKCVGAQPEDTVVLLQPTSPLRSDDDVRRTIAGHTDAGCCITVQECEVHPFKALIEREDGFAAPRDLDDLEAPRQQLPRAVAPNGAVYVIRFAELVARESFYAPPIRIVIMPEDRSIDIDSPRDLARAEAHILNAPFTFGSVGP